MQINQTPLANIRPYSRNAKKHPEAQIKAIADSIREFGFNQPIVVDPRGVIIVGHGRYFAALQLALDEVPAMTVDLLEDRAMAYRLADNKLNESDWNMPLVLEELKELGLKGFDLKLTGFDKAILLDSIETEEEPEIKTNSHKKEITCPECGAEFTSKL